MGEEQPARPGPESAPPLAEAPSAAAPPRAVPRPFALRSVAPRLRVLSPRVLGPRVLSPRAAGADPVTWLIAAVMFAAYAVISLSRLVQLKPTSWDLGIYTEYVKQYANLSAPIVDIRAPGFNLLGDHFQPIVAVLTPFFRVFPSAATLLIAQALLAAASVFPVSQLAREKLGTGPGRAIAFAYGFSWACSSWPSSTSTISPSPCRCWPSRCARWPAGTSRRRCGGRCPCLRPGGQGFTVAAIGVYLIVAGLRATVPGRRPG